MICAADAFVKTPQVPRYMYEAKRISHCQKPADASCYNGHILLLYLCDLHVEVVWCAQLNQSCSQSDRSHEQKIQFTFHLSRWQIWQTVEIVERASDDMARILHRKHREEMLVLHFFGLHATGRFQGPIQTLLFQHTWGFSQVLLVTRRHCCPRGRSQSVGSCFVLIGSHGGKNMHSQRKWVLDGVLSIALLANIVECPAYINYVHLMYAREKNRYNNVVLPRMMNQDV